MSSTADSGGARAARSEALIRTALPVRIVRTGPIQRVIRPEIGASANMPMTCALITNPTVSIGW